MSLTIVATPGLMRRGQSQPYGSGKATFSCAHCGTQFREWRSQVKTATPYCSKACFFASKKGKPSYRRVIRSVARVCVECGGWMAGTPSQMRRHILCSEECQAKYLSGVACPAWRGGVSSERQRVQNSDAYKVWRRSVLIRDQGMCRECAQAGVVTRHRLEVHHIVPFYKDKSLALVRSNGITLCHEHHVATLGKEHAFGQRFRALADALEAVA